MLDCTFSLLYFLPIGYGLWEIQMDFPSLLTGIALGLGLAFALVAYSDRRRV